MPRSPPRPGHEVDTLTPEQLAAWRTAVAPLTARWASKVDNGDKVLADLKAAPATQKH